MLGETGTGRLLFLVPAALVGALWGRLKVLAGDALDPLTMVLGKTAINLSEYVWVKAVGVMRRVERKTEVTR